MKPNINDQSNQLNLKSSLAEKNVSSHAISTIENAIKNGLQFKNSVDLNILNLPAGDMKIIEDNVRYGPAAPPNVKTIQFTFKPVGNEDFFYGYQFLVMYTNSNAFTIVESFPVEDTRIVHLD